MTQHLYCRICYEVFPGGELSKVMMHMSDHYAEHILELDKKVKWLQQYNFPKS